MSRSLRAVRRAAGHLTTFFNKLLAGAPISRPFPTTITHEYMEHSEHMEKREYNENRK